MLHLSWSGWGTQLRNLSFLVRRGDWNPFSMIPSLAAVPSTRSLILGRESRRRRTIKICKAYCGLIELASLPYRTPMWTSQEVWLAMSDPICPSSGGTTPSISQQRTPSWETA